VLANAASGGRLGQPPFKLIAVLRLRTLLSSTHRRDLQVRFLLALIDAPLGAPGDRTEPRLNALKHSRRTKLLAGSV
jgi:hypothetical protein